MPLKQGKTEKYLWEKVNSQGAVLFSLIDPDKCPGEKGAKLAKQSYENGADAILIGGSIGAQGTVVDETVKKIKEQIDIPVILFPGNISGVTQFADAVYFMQMLNSRDVYWLSTAQIQAAPVVHKLGLEAIPTSYVVLEPGRAVGWVGNANLLPRDRPDLAYACAMAAKYIGAHVLIEDSGSGSPDPAPLDIVKATAKACGDELLYFLGGGVKTAAQAGDIIAAGAHGIQVGTAFESGEAGKKIKELAAAVHAVGKKRP